MKNNFLIARLCDNDYGHHMCDAIREAVRDYGMDGSVDVSMWKEFIIAYAMGRELKREVWFGNPLSDALNDAQKTQIYLTDALEVGYSVHLPTTDDDSGSACLDLNTLQAWIY